MNRKKARRAVTVAHREAIAAAHYDAAATLNRLGDRLAAGTTPAEIAAIAETAASIRAGVAAAIKTDAKIAGCGVAEFVNRRINGRPVADANGMDTNGNGSWTTATSKKVAPTNIMGNVKSQPAAKLIYDKETETIAHPAGSKVKAATVKQRATRRAYAAETEKFRARKSAEIRRAIETPDAPARAWNADKQKQWENYADSVNAVDYIRGNPGRDSGLPSL